MSQKTPTMGHLAKQIAALGEEGRPRAARKVLSKTAEACGDFGIRIARDGTWFYHGSPIGRKSLVRLFSTVLHRDSNGEYWLVTPAERGRIEVEDVPFIATALTATGRGRDQIITLETNVGDRVTVDADHPLRMGPDPAVGAPAPYVLVRDGLEARLGRAVYYDLVDLGMEHRVGKDHLFGVWSSGTFFPLGRLTDPA